MIGFQDGIYLSNVQKSYGDLVVLNDVNLRVGAGEIVALCGCSGAGKSTLLSILFGTTKPDFGKISFFGNESFKNETTIGALFQDDALFNDMTVLDNIAVGLGFFSGFFVTRPKLQMINLIKQSMLDFLLEEEVADMYPDQLSGGMSRRIALMRAMIGAPMFVIADEPTSGLDLVSSAAVGEIFKTHKRKNKHSATLIVTHDTDFAVEVADYLAILSGGKIVYFGDAASCTKEFLADLL